MKFLSCEKLSEHKYKTPEGYLICVDSVLARTGKQTYKRSEVFGPDCKDADVDVEIDRPEKEVFSEKTLASFENKPLTVEHPDTDVNVGNHNELAVGFVRDIKRGNIDGNDVMLGTLVITDAKTIEEIENGEHTDLSCGYDCDINDEENPCQRNIRGNHVALCQQGRAGIAHIVDSKVRDNIYFVETWNGYDIWKDNTDEYYVALTKSGKKLARIGAKSLSRAKQILTEYDEDFKDSVKDGRTRTQIQTDIDKIEREIDWCEDHNNVWKLNDLHKQLDKLQEELKGVKDAVHTILCKDKVFHFETIDKDGKIGAIAVEANNEIEAKLKAEQDLKREIAMFGKQMRLGKIYSIDDSIKDEDAQYKWMVELDRNNIDYVFINGGYGMEFRNQNDYAKAKELAKKVNYTQGHWDDKKLTSFDYRSTRISNELDSVKDSLKTFEVEYKDGNNVVIQLVKAKSFEDTIKKVKELKK